MEEPEMENEKPPILGSWKNLYLLLVGALIIQVLIYYSITISFS